MVRTSLYTFIQQQGILSKQILSKTPRGLRYIDRSVFMKEVDNQNLWTFELASQESMNVPIWIIIGLQQQDRHASQDLTKYTFCRLPITSAQCFTVPEKNPDASIFLNYDDDDDYNQGYGQIKEAFKSLTKMISFKHMCQIMISDLQMLDLMMLVIIFTLSI